jgi:hypothetical protein
MAVPNQFANTPNGSTIPLAKLDQNFNYIENQINDLSVVTSFSGGSTGLLPATASTGIITLTGRLNVANGGTGANTASGAMTNLLPAQTGQGGKFLTTDGNGNLSWATSGSSGVTGVANGGTGLTATPVAGQLLIGNGTGYTLSTLTAGTGISIANTAGGITINATGGGGTGTVTSVGLSGGTTGFTVSGTPITTNGTFTLGGILGVANGGTGQSSTAGALTALLPAQSGATTGQVLTSNGTTANWATNGSGSGTVNSGTLNQVAYYAANGTAVSGNANVTTTSAGNLTAAGTIAATQGLSIGPSGSLYLGVTSSAIDIGAAGQTINLDGAGINMLNLTVFWGFGLFPNQPFVVFKNTGGTTLGTITFDGLGNAFEVGGGSGTIISSNLTNGNFTITGAGFQPGGGLWTTTSDARVKSNVAPYQLSVADLETLNPVTYTYNGLYGTVNNGKTHHGFIAQDVLNTPFQSMVDTYTHEDKETNTSTEIYSINTTQLVFALLNAVKELNQRIAALEAK